MPETLTIPARFNGPPGVAQGGYTSGRLAALLGAEVASVSLRKPTPLERPLAVERREDRVELHDGDTLLAECHEDELLLDVPDAVDPDRAAAASLAGRERWSRHHPFPRCVGCGPEREPGDGMRLVPGELDHGVFAAVWMPDNSLSDCEGLVRPECVWAALDCPSAAPVANFASGPPQVLARLTARLGCPVRVGERHVILSWSLGVDGRRRHGACALFDSKGLLVCASRALWIELRA